MRTIKLEENKVTMRPIKGEKGITEVWTRYRPIEEEGNPQFIICDGRSYYRTSIKE